MTKTTTAPQIATFFLNSWVMSYKVVAFLFTDNGTQFVTAVFNSMCLHLCWKLLTTTVSYSKTKGKTERYNIVTSLCPYVNQHQGSLKVFVPLLTHEHNSQVDCLTKQNSVQSNLDEECPVTN